MSETEQAPASGGVDVDALEDAIRAGIWFEYTDAGIVFAALGALNKLTATLRETTAELTALRARVEAAERDTARIDWLQKQVHDTADGSIGDVSLHGNWTGIAVVVGETPVAAHGEGLTLRAAIDAALSPSPTPRTEP